MACITKGSFVSLEWLIMFESKVFRCISIDCLSAFIIGSDFTETSPRRYKTCWRHIRKDASCSTCIRNKATAAPMS